jgi:transposase-like protein
VSHSIEASDDKFLPGVSPEETLPPKRRRYTLAFKLRIIEQADACTLPGALAMLLRREGIYFSTLQDFRKQKARGDLGAHPGATRAARSIVPDTQTLKDLAASERDNRRLRRELEKARALLDLQKKVSELMGLSLEPQE